MTGIKIVREMTIKKVVRMMDPSEGAFIPLIELHLFAAARS
jgi:hypothetical protein